MTVVGKSSLAAEFSPAIAITDVMVIILFDGPVLACSTCTTCGRS